MHKVTSKRLEAKKASADKAKAGGFAQNEGKAFGLGDGVLLPGGNSEKDLFAEANKLKAQIRELKDTVPDGKPLPKSKSAKLAQLKQMEKLSREKAQAEYEQVQAREARAARREKAKAAGTDKSSDYGEAFSKITGSELPSLPSLDLPVPALPSLPSLPF